MTSADRRQLWFWIVAASVAVLLFFFIARWRERAMEQRQTASFLTGDALRGARLFEQKGCANCHPWDSPPRHGAPDLRAYPADHASVNTLVSAMWNHAPSMWDRIAQVGIAYPLLNEGDMADLFAFLYVVRYIDEPGSALRGQDLFFTKDCVRCHAIQGEGGTLGPDLARVENADAPIVWVQRMWNHAFAMQEEMRREVVTWPRFHASEMSDLLAYLRSVNRTPRRLYELFPADVRSGRELFGDKGCIQCHQFGREGQSVAPDLTRLPQVPRSVSQMAGSMWNHWPEMAEWMKHRQMRAPVFEEKEMADLIAYLYALRYFDEPGHAQDGKQVYSLKHCNHCHGEDGRGTPDGPSLVRRKGKFSALALATAVWRHGPRMHEEMERQGLAWPKFQEHEMNNLIAYLNTW